MLLPIRARFPKPFRHPMRFQGPDRARNRPCGRVKVPEPPAVPFQGQMGTETGTQQAANGNYRLPKDKHLYFRAWNPLLDCPKGYGGTADQPTSGPEGALRTSCLKNSRPEGAISHAPPPNPWQSRNQVVDPVSQLDLMGPIFYPWRRPLSR